MLTAHVIAIVAIAFLLAGFVKGTVGLGLPIISIAILAATIGLKSAVALFLIPAMATNLWQAFVGGNLVWVLRRLWPLLLGAIAGIMVGVRILVTADASLLMVLLGLVMVFYATIGLTRAHISVPPRWEPWLTPIVGVAGGVMFGMMGNFMVPGVLYIQALGLSRDHFVQALGVTFLTISVTLAITLQRHSLMPLETVLMSAAAVVPTGIGVFLGQRFRKRLSEAQFRQVVLVAVGCAGIYMIVRSVIG